TLAASEQGVRSPGDPGQQHQQCSQQRWGAGARQQQRQQAGRGQCRAKAGSQVQAFAAQPAPEQHAQLYGAEQQQRAGTGIQLQIGEGEGGRIGEQRQSARPVAGHGPFALSQFQQSPQGQRAAEQADEGEAGSVSVGFTQCQTAQQRVAGKRQHGEGGEQQDTQRHRPSLGE